MGVFIQHPQDPYEYEGETFYEYPYPDSDERRAGYWSGQLMVRLKGEAIHVSSIGIDSGDVPVPFAMLPHSCDNWVIGGPDRIRELIHDLMEALKLMEESR